MKKVLVVEDNEFLRSTVSALLRSMGFDPVEASDGQSGQELFLSDEGIVYVLSDVQMPRKTGVELHVDIFQELKRRGGTFVACSGDYHCPEKNYFMGQGVLFLQKPYDRSQLQEIFSP